MTQPRTLVFLHGVGDGNLSAHWQAPLNDALERHGYATLGRDRIRDDLRYAALLQLTPTPSARIPATTIPKLSKDDADRARWAYERQQAALERLLGPGVEQAGPFAFLPGIPGFATRIVAQAHRYVTNDRLRGAVLRTLLDRIPLQGEIVLVAHSLGSLVAIDLLDHLPPNLTVTRLITIGSPGGNAALHGTGERLLKDFPLTRVESWVNVWSVKDPVPYGRGISGFFPHALDIRIDLGLGEHSAAAYCAHPTVARAIGDALDRSPASVSIACDTTVERPLDDAEALVLVGFAYGHRLAAAMRDRRMQARYRAALAIVQRDAIESLATHYQREQRSMPKELMAVADGREPERFEPFDVARSIPALLVVASNNVIAPYEIDQPAAERCQALEEIANFLGFRRRHGTVLFEALTTARKVVQPGWPIPTWLLGAGGLALLIAGPIGLALAAPAGLAGGAAVMGALAAFGPGGIVGGLVTAGALSSTGAGMAVLALVSAATAEAFESAVVHQLAVALARKKLKEPRSDQEWFTLAALEAELARKLQQVVPYSDPKAPSIRLLRAKAEAVRRAVAYLVDRQQAPSLTASTGSEETRDEVRAE